MKQARIIEITDPSWKKLLEDTKPEFYQLPQYLKLDSELNNAIPKAFYFELDAIKVIIPFYLNTLVFDGIEHYRYDARSPYGYPGILSSQDLSQDQLHQILRSLMELSKQSGILTYFLKLNPFTNIYDNFSFPPEILFINHGKVVYFDLTQTEEDISAALSKNHKRNIKKLNKQGFCTTINHWEEYKKFQAIYIETMQRQNASSYYMFDENYFDKLRKIVGKNLYLCTVHDANGKLATSGLFSGNGNIAQYHFMSTCNMTINNNQLYYQRNRS